MNLQYVSGFFDADGYITLTKISSKREIAKTAVIGFTNTHLPILLEIQSFLSEHGLKGTINKKAGAKENHATGYDLRYQRNYALKLAEFLLPLSIHPKKNHRLSTLLFHYKNVVPRNGKYSKEMLENLQQFEKQFFQEAV